MGKPGAPQFAKLTRPRLHRPHPRERLFRLLDSRDTHPVTWISGPPGCGKTTLVAHYVEQRRLDAYWYRVDETDLDLAAFFAQIALLVPTASGPDGLPYFTPDYLHALQLFSRQYFRTLYARLGSGWVLVLDDCHAAAGEDFQRVLDSACRELPPACSLVLISREARPAALVHLVASQKLIEIGWSQLRLELDEVRAVAQRQGVAAAMTAEHLWDYTDGWAAGVVLLTLNPDLQAAPSPARRITQDSVFAYFASEVFTRATQAEQEFLATSALFPEVTSKMAVELTGNSTGAELLRELHRRNLFVQHKAEADSYQYHDLFRAFLLSRLEDNMPPRRLKQLRGRAARILLRKGMHAEAINLFIRAGDWRAAGAALRANAARLLHQGQWRSLLDWFEELPQDVIATDPWLLLWNASALEVVDVDRASRYASRAYRLFLRNGDWAGQVHAIYLQLDVVWISARSVRGFSKWMPVLEKHLGSRRSLPHAELGIRAWNAYLQLAVYGRHRGVLLPRASKWMTGCSGALNLHGNQRLSAGDILLAYAIYTTDVSLGESLRTSLAPLVEDAAVSALGRMFAIKWVGRWDLALGRFESALCHFDHGLRLAELCRARAQSVDIASYRAITLCLLGRGAEARSALAQTSLDANDNAYIRATHHEGWAFYCTHVGDFKTAITHQRQSEQAWRRFGIPLTIADSTLRLGLWHLLSGDVSSAHRLLRRAQRLFSGTVARYADSVIEFGLAHVALCRGKRSDALRHLRSGLDAANNPVKAEMLRWISTALPALLDLALQFDVAPDLTRDLIRRFDVPAPVNACAGWPWPVRIETLGKFEVLVNGAPLAVRGRARYKQYELLKLLVCQMGRSISADAAAEWLWPDAEGDGAQNSLKVTLHRLRRLLGHEAVRVHDGKLALDPRTCWVDAWIFSAGCDRANGSTTDSNAVRPALLLYRGQFLPQDLHAWILPVRARLRQRFSKAVSALGKTLEAQGAGEEAMELYMYCLDAEPEIALQPFPDGN